MTAHILILAALATTAAAQQLPDGPGRAEIEKMCKGCHEMARSLSLRQDRDGWSSTMSKMTAFGMKASEQEINLALDYLAKHYPAGETPPLNMNKATAIQLESTFSLRRSQAAAIIDYRTKHGEFKSINDLKKIPNIDIAKIEAKKDRIVF